ncbi:hypothetical protein CTEN210_16772 [Chaetoceros tenuissimus]|uniref:DUF6824 domain-containing protein n=1 Tax=Chaetoceros tenuissimus TaxID=426638 RepID=A0AAD3D9E8_9STRA|nr:hypothetical protein CTEN210_16772 [Chaetoceros tenuissimus]
MAVINPGDNDVLLGRGGNNNKHVGNQKLRKIALSYAQEYSKCTKMGKSDLSKLLVQKVRELDPPGRFLKQDSTTLIWKDVGDVLAREKTSQVLRDAVKSYKKLPPHLRKNTTSNSKQQTSSEKNAEICTRPDPQIESNSTDAMDTGMSLQAPISSLSRNTLMIERQNLRNALTSSFVRPSDSQMSVQSYEDSTATSTTAMSSFYEEPRQNAARYRQAMNNALDNNRNNAYGYYNFPLQNGTPSPRRMRKKLRGIRNDRDTPNNHLMNHEARSIEEQEVRPQGRFHLAPQPEPDRNYHASNRLREDCHPASRSNIRNTLNGLVQRDPSRMHEDGEDWEPIDDVYN